jgi:hypothetical protein
MRQNSIKILVLPWDNNSGLRLHFLAERQENPSQSHGLSELLSGGYYLQIIHCLPVTSSTLSHLISVQPPMRKIVLMSKLINLNFIGFQPFCLLNACLLYLTQWQWFLLYTFQTPPEDPMSPTQGWSSQQLLLEEQGWMPADLAIFTCA